MNTNGIISLDAPFNSSYIRALLLDGTEKIIAPYWSNIDTRGSGKIFYRETAEPSLLSRASSEIQAAFPMSENVTIKNLLIATWDAVGYFPERADKVRYYYYVAKLLNIKREWGLCTVKLNLTFTMYTHVWQLHNSNIILKTLATCMGCMYMKD